MTTDINQLSKALDNLTSAERYWIGYGVQDKGTSEGDNLYGISLLILLYCPERLSKQKCYELATVNSLLKAKIKSTVRHKKNLTEQEKRDLIFSLSLELNSDTILELWNEYSAGETKEAQFVFDSNELSLVLQSKSYVDNGKLQPFVFATFLKNALQNTNIKSDVIKDRLKDLFKRAMANPDIKYNKVREILNDLEETPSD